MVGTVKVSLSGRWYAMVDAEVARRLLEAERERLQAVHRGLEADAVDERESGHELAALDQHQADVGSEVFEREKERSILNRVDVDLDDVAEALRRLDSGTYGMCETCGVAIPEERLAAVPATRFCADHEALWEGHKMTLSLPEGAYGDGAAPAQDLAGREALRHLEFLPTDDEPRAVEELGAEEQALHMTYPDTTRSEALDPDETERVEMQEAGLRSDQRIEAQMEVDARREAAEVVFFEEVGLDRAGSSSPRPSLWRRLLWHERR